MCIFCLAGFGTCLERRTKVTLADGNPPTFVLSGNGYLTSLVIDEPKQRGVSDDRPVTLWEIQPMRHSRTGRSVEDIGAVKYGVVPEGYKQVYPANEASPAELIAGKKYQYWATTMNAEHAAACFEIRDNKAVAAEYPK